MEILLIARPDLLRNYGGDSVQVEQIRHHLARMGVNATLWDHRDTGAFGRADIVHFFNLFRPATLLSHLHRITTPLVISTIYVDYSSYEKGAAGGLRQWAARGSGKHGMEYLKEIARRLKARGKFPPLPYLLKGQKRAIHTLLERADRLITTTHSEYGRIVADFPGTETPYRRILPGIRDVFLKNPPTTKSRRGVGCAARIEPLKNQFALIRACKMNALPLQLAGKAAPNHQKYFRRCKALEDENIRFTGQLDDDRLLELYDSLEVHALPSWFETTGLSSLEAGARGCRLVVGEGGDIREIFGPYATYTGTGEKEIARALENAMNSENTRGIPYFRENFRWDTHAGELVEVYEQQLKEKS